MILANVSVCPFDIVALGVGPFTLPFALPDPGSAAGNSGISLMSSVFCFLS